MRIWIALAVVILAIGSVVAGALQASPRVETVLAAGDIATCSSRGDERTAAVLARERGTVLTLGDNVYPRGTAAAYARCYGPSWGRFRGRTRPAPGNRDYAVPTAAGYRSYFGLGRTYYAFDLGSWRLYALDSERVTAAQLAWLRRDLEQHPRPCVLAYWSRPLFSTGAGGDQARVRPFWQLLYRAGAEIVLSAHDPAYERLTPLNPIGNRDDVHGLREFVVGTGGAPLSSVHADPRTLARNGSVPGVIRLRLGPRGYGWRFLSTDGSFTDTGGDSCHGKPS